MTPLRAIAAIATGWAAVGLMVTASVLWPDASALIALAVTILGILAIAFIISVAVYDCLTREPPRRPGSNPPPPLGRRPTPPPPPPPAPWQSGNAGRAPRDP